MKPIAIHLAEKLAAELRILQAEVERLNTTPPAAPVPLTDDVVQILKMMCRK
jgi:hypothetical protein